MPEQGLLHFYAWGFGADDDFMVCAHARSIAEARRLALLEIENSSVFEPVRERAGKFVENTVPSIFHRECAYFSCRVNSYTEDLNIELDRISEQLKEARAAVAK